MPGPTIEDAVALAARAHRGQTDKAGKPYILHPLRLMLRFQDEPARIVAVLHDILEDTAVTAAELRELGYSEEVLEALDALTRRPSESYDEFIGRAGRIRLARRVKLADLDDNLDASRLDAVGEDDRKRLARYQAARQRLVSMEDGPTADPPSASPPRR